MLKTVKVPESWHIIVLLAILCSLAGMDLLRQFWLKSEEYWYSAYIDAVKSHERYWEQGYHIEDIELKIESQISRMQKLSERLHMLRQELMTPNIRSGVVTTEKKTSSRIITALDKSIINTRKGLIWLEESLHNKTEVYQIHCENSGPTLRIGVNDFSADQRFICQIFVSPTSSVSGPHTMFEYVALADGTFALKSIANGLYVTAVPPPSDNTHNPWKLVIGGAAIGAAEVFRLTSDGVLYSPLVGGYFSCSKGQMVSGQPGIYSTPNHFILEKVSPLTLENALLLVDLSNKVKTIQSEYMNKNQISTENRKSEVAAILGTDSAKVVKICIGLPITSKGTAMDEIAQSPFWNNIFDSFMKSIDWRMNRYEFRFYLGFDKADSIYDTGDAWQELRTEFKERATYRMTEQLLDEMAIQTVLEKQLSLKLMHFDHLEGSPSQIVSQLMLQAYHDNFDYFYQVNDDTIIITPNWAPKLIEKLASNPLVPNFGVTGPIDSNNEKIFTHCFVHRIHFEIFGHLFPTYFKNWWSDDWISAVYGSEHTFRIKDVMVKHNIQAQKTHGINRYEADQSAQFHLDDELLGGHVQIDGWLKKNNLPRLSLPIICNYIPLVRHIANRVKAKGHSVGSNSMGLEDTRIIEKTEVKKNSGSIQSKRKGKDKLQDDYFVSGDRSRGNVDDIVREDPHDVQKKDITYTVRNAKEESKFENWENKLSD